MDDGARVLVVDDHPVVRRGLLAILAGEPWVRATTEADTLAAARRSAALDPPDLVIVDLRLPDGDGLELIGELSGREPPCRCLALTMDAEASRVRAALAAGALGYLVKDSEPDLVVDALRTIVRGGVVIGTGLLRPTRTTSQRHPFEGLTARERELAARVIRGHDNARIARDLGLAEKTVRNVLSGILVKVGVRDRVNLALLGREFDIESIPEAGSTGEGYP